jgi:hypothetical protein
MIYIYIYIFRLPYAISNIFFVYIKNEGINLFIPWITIHSVCFFFTERFMIIYILLCVKIHIFRSLVILEDGCRIKKIIRFKNRLSNNACLVEMKCGPCCFDLACLSDWRWWLRPFKQFNSDTSVICLT